MVSRITWGRLRAYAWSEFERSYRANVIDSKTVKGFRGRLLVQDSGDKDTGFAIRHSNGPQPAGDNRGDSS